MRAGPLFRFFGGYRELLLSIEANSVGPEQTAPIGAVWIWVRTVCHRGFLSISADVKSRRLLLRLAH